MTASLASGPHPAEPLPTDLGGYRLVRVLGRGPRATTVLVHDEGVTCVARVFRTSCPTSTIDAELAVHDAIRAADAALGDHTASADDLATLGDGRLVLLTPQVAGPRLDDLLAGRRGTLQLGEAITVLAPLALALDVAHAAGITGLGLSARAVRLSAGGAPVIVRVHDAHAGPALPERFRAREPAYIADLAAFEHLGVAVAAAVPERDQSALLAALRAPTLGRDVAPALFDLAEPLPVTVSSSAPQELPGAPTFSPAVVSPPADESAARLPTWAAAALDAARALGLPPGVIDPARAAGERLVEAAARAATSLSRVPGIRPRFLIAGAAGVGALLIALVLIGVPPGSAEGAAPGRDPAEGPDLAARSDPAAPVDPAHAPLGSAGGDRPDAAGETPENALHPEAEEWQGIVATLVDRWSECRTSVVSAEASVACEQRVAHAGSAAARLLLVDDERHAVLERWSTLRGDAVVVERMGGAVLIDLVAAGTTTASLLIVRSEAGWRIRDVIG